MEVNEVIEELKWFGNEILLAWQKGKHETN